MSDYPTTAVPFADLPLRDLVDPVVTGPGHGGVTDAAESYRQLGDLLKTASEDLRVAMVRSREAHEGGAAELAEQYVNRVVAVGELGAGQAQITADALHDGAAFYARVRDDMNALPDVEPAGSLREANRVQRDLDANKVIAVEAAERYERNANWALGRQFPVYEAPAVEPPGTSPAAAGAAGGSGSVGAPGGVPAGAAPAAAGGAGSGAPPVAGGPGGVGGPIGASPTPVGVGAAGGSGVGGSGAGAGPVRGAAASGTGSSGSTPLGSAVAGSGASGPGLGGPGVSGSGGAASPGRRTGTGDGRGGSGPPSLEPASEAPDIGRYPGAAGPPDPATPTGWQPGQPWSARPAPDPTGPGGYAGVPGGSGDPYAQPGARPPGTPPAAAAPAGGPIRGTPGSGIPFFPGAGGAGRGLDAEHARPSWLVQDDPQAFWFSGLPDHGPGVIGGEGDCDH